VEWVEKYENIDGRFRFFEACLIFSSLPTGWEASLLNEEHWLNGCGTHGKAIQALHPHQE
jgi:hypothetical protein